MRFRQIRSLVSNLLSYTTTNPSTPTSGIFLFNRLRAARSTPAFVNTNGQIIELGSSIATRRVAGIRATGLGSSTVAASFASAATTSGTATAVTADNTTFLGNLARVRYVTTAATAQIAGVKSSASATRGATAGAGGFHFVTRFVIDVVNSGHAIFAGIDSITTLQTDAEPSAFLNIFGVGADSTDTNMQLMHNDGSGAATKTNLGASFPAKTAGTAYELRIFALPNDTVIYYSLQVIQADGNGAIASGSANTNIPVNTGNTRLFPFIWQSTRATSSLAEMSLCSMITETPF